MKLRYEVESLEGIDEKYHDLYTQGADGKFRLDADGIPDVTGLRQKTQELLDEKKAEQRKAREEAEKRAKAEGDIASLEDSYKQRLREAEEARENDTKTLRGKLEALTVGRTATELAAELAVEGATKLLLPHIQSRLRMDLVDGEPVVRVLDAAGKLSAMTIDQLKEEIKADESLARVVRATKASGGGADGGNKTGGGASKKLSEMNHVERTEWARRDPVGFEQAVKASKAQS